MLLTFYRELRLIYLIYLTADVYLFDKQSKYIDIQLIKFSTTGLYETGAWDSTSRLSSKPIKTWGIYLTGVC